MTTVEKITITLQGKQKIDRDTPSGDFDQAAAKLAKALTTET
jgi:hypothetical protein